jgi:hypothetical protein
VKNLTALLSPDAASDVQIVVLVLSQDEVLAKAVHKIKVHSVPWYKEGPLAGISLGSLIFTVLLRAAQKNLVGAKDVYLHSNALAALANFAPFAVNLTSHATNRLVAVLETGYKRLKWLSGSRVRFTPFSCLLVCIIFDWKVLARGTSGSSVK